MMLTAAAVVVGSAVILFDPIFQGLAISLMAGEVASLLLSRMTVPVLFYYAAPLGDEPIVMAQSVRKGGMEMSLERWIRLIAGVVYSDQPGPGQMGESELALVHRVRGGKPVSVVADPLVPDGRHTGQTGRGEKTVTDRIYSPPAQAAGFEPAGSDYFSISELASFSLSMKKASKMVPSCITVLTVTFLSVTSTTK